MDGAKVACDLDDLREQIHREVPRIVFVLIQHPRQGGGGKIAMTRHTRKADSRSIHDRRDNLFQGAELLRDARLEVERKLELGNCRDHMFPVLSGSGDSGTVKLSSPENFRTEISASDQSPSDMLESGPVFGSNQLLEPKPLRNELLADGGPIHELGDPLGQGGLTASDLNRSAERGNVLLFHKRREYTTNVVPVNDSCRVPKNQETCTVLLMPLKQQKAIVRHAKEPKNDQQVIRGPDGLTLGERLERCMALKSRKLGRPYLQKDLLEDTNRAAGRSTNDRPVITQQGLSLIMKNRRSESAVTPAFAAALEVEALWLQYGVGPPSYLQALIDKS